MLFFSFLASNLPENYDENKGWKGGRPSELQGTGIRVVSRATLDQLEFVIIVKTVL